MNIFYLPVRDVHTGRLETANYPIYIWVKWCPRGQANKIHTRAKGPTEIQMKFYESDQHIVIGTEHRLGLKYGKTLSGKEFAQNL